MSPFNLAECEARIKELHEQMEAPAFWDDVDAAQKVNKEVKMLTDRVTSYNKLYTGVQETLELCELADAEGDEELIAEVCKDTA